MAAGRLVGEHFNQNGQPKRGYSNERTAKQEAGRFGKTYYRCTVCQKFHLATVPRDPKRVKR